MFVTSVRYEDPGAVEGLAGALDTRLQVTGGVCIPQQHTNVFEQNIAGELRVGYIILVISIY